MTSSLKKIIGMGGDVRKIAALLQSKAPKGHKLASAFILTGSSSRRGKS